MAIPFSVSGLIIITLAMILGSALQGSVGYGAALVAAPLLVLVDYRLVPVPFAIASFFLVVFMMWRERQAIDLRGLMWAVIGRIPGSFLGAVILAHFTADSFVLIFAFLVLFAVVISASGVHFFPSKATLLGAGFLSGLMGTIASIGGPPLALIYQESDADEMRSTLAGYFIISIFVSSAAWATVGLFNVEVVYLFLFLIPGMLIGYLLSFQIVRYIDGKYTRPVVLSVAAISGLYVLIQQILRYI